MARKRDHKRGRQQTGQRSRPVRWLLILFGGLLAVWIGSGLERDRMNLPTQAVLPTTTKVVTETPFPSPTPTPQEAPSTIMNRIMQTQGALTAVPSDTFTPSATFTSSKTSAVPAQTFPTLPLAQPSTVQPLIRSPYTCNGIDDLNCDDFLDGGADAHLAMCGDEDRLDRDKDGDACEPGWD